MKLRLLLFACLVSSPMAAQDTSAVSIDERISELKGAFEGLNETVVDMKNVLDAMKKIKVSGYLQAQFQSADSAGISSYSGGNFPEGVRSRFSVRRGRLKVAYDNDLSLYVLQVDVTQSGVGIKDAYATVRDPWLRTVSLTAGVFDRPFGFEISYSSSRRETPERSRLFQKLFPGEREVGAKVEIAAEEGLLSYFNLKAGIFNGVGPTASENDRNKDFIGRIGGRLPFDNESIAIDGGFSIYAGKVASNSKQIYSIDEASPLKHFRVDSAATNADGNIGRAYYGADLQFYYRVPVLGKLALRGEYLIGQQPGTSASNSFYNPGTTVTPLYIRKFSGWYINYVQNIGSNNQFLLKYDLLDPNTDVETKDIGASGSNLTIGDLKFSTLGIGWIYHWDANVKFLLYYDMVKNETANAAATGALVPYKDDIKDNVLTARIQFRF